MGKRKINTLRGKRLVTGNPNLITMNEIHVKDTQKGIEVTERDKNGKLVNVNVPQSGESGGGESVGGNIEYLDVSNEPYLLDLIGLQCIECKGISDAISIVAPTAAVRLLVEGAGVKITQIKVDWDVTVIKNIGDQIIKTTVLEGILNEVGQDELDNVPRITKEEFYNLDGGGINS